MNAELYGLFGAIGGALIAGAAAYVGPIRLHQRTAEDQRRLTAQQRSWNTQDELERETRALEAAAHSRSVDAGDAELMRLAAARTAPRYWDGIIRRAAFDLVNGDPVDPDKFDEQVEQARREVTAALDAVLLDGLWIRQSSSTPPAYSDSWLNDYLDPDPAAERLDRLQRIRYGPALDMNVTEPLEEATIVVRRHVRGRAPTDEDLAHIERALRRVHLARGELAQHILHRMGEIIEHRTQR
ncbi:hypothetical protein OG216_00320 [Streptomycetaceae bacterium NBC_01309]